MLGILFALSAAVGFGATAFFARLSVQHMRPTTGVIVSLVVGVICTSVFVVAMDGAEALSLEWTQFALLFLAGLASFVGGRPVELRRRLQDWRRSVESGCGRVPALSPLPLPYSCWVKRRI